MTAELARGFVLHRRPYRETSLLVEVFTEGQGRIGLVARGAARGRRRGCPLEPFSRLRLAWMGRGELHTLTGCEADRRFALGRHELAFGLYFNELLLRLLPREAALAEAYGAYERAIAALGRHAQPWEVMLEFELALLDALGHPLRAAAAELAAAGARDAPGYWYRPQEGVVALPGGEGIPLCADALHALAGSSGGGRDALLRFTRALIDRLAGGRELETRRLLPTQSTQAPPPSRPGP